MVQDRSLSSCQTLRPSQPTGCAGIATLTGVRASGIPHAEASRDGCSETARAHRHHASRGREQNPVQSPEPGAPGLGGKHPSTDGEGRGSRPHDHAIRVRVGAPQQPSQDQVQDRDEHPRMLRNRCDGARSESFRPLEEAQDVEELGACRRRKSLEALAEGVLGLLWLSADRASRLSRIRASPGNVILPMALSSLVHRTGEGEARSLPGRLDRYRTPLRPVSAATRS